MSTHDLREALESHARFDDTAALVRLAGVQQRVRTVRRRRRAVVAGAAAAVLATVGGVATLMPSRHHPEPASRVFGTLTAPETMTSLGYTYTFDKLVTGTGEVTVTDDIDGAFLVSWAGAGTGPVEVGTAGNVDDGELPVTSSADFADYIAVANNQQRSISARGEGRLALAVYKLARTAPGTTAQGATFRDDIGSARAIAAAWGDAGAPSLEVTFTYPARTLVVRDFCAAPKGYVAHLSYDGSKASSGPCSDSSYFDATGSDSSYPDGLDDGNGHLYRAGDRVTARLWVTRRGSSAPVQGHVAGLRLGLALYEEKPAVAHLLDWPLTELREHGGHTYRFVDVTEAEHPVSGWGISRTVEERPLIFVFSVQAKRGFTQVVVDGRPGTGFGSGGGSFQSTEGPFTSGRHRIALRGKALGPDTPMAIAVYEQVD